MATETYLDRIQQDVRRALNRARAISTNGKLLKPLTRAYADSRKALGRTRSALEYHKPARQKTLRSYGAFPPWQKHVPRQRGR